MTHENPQLAPNSTHILFGTPDCNRKSTIIEATGNS